MIVIPAIDIMDSQVVRLEKGIMENPKIYNKNPLDMAKLFEDMGAERLHIVDLNGAKSGESINYKEIEKITNKSSLKIEVGGGIRNISRIKDYINMGVSYCILGTVTIKNPDITMEALETYPNQIILGLDAKNGMVATEGWYETSSLTVANVIDKYSKFKVESVIVTDIDKDGMMQGVNSNMINDIANISPFPVIASGGVSSIDDIIVLKELNNKNIKGCITGKAIYEGKIDLKAAFSL